jgi:hypothetical protein
MYSKHCIDLSFFETLVNIVFYCFCFSKILMLVNNGH